MNSLQILIGSKQHIYFAVCSYYPTHMITASSTSFHPFVHFRQPPIIVNQGESQAAVAASSSVLGTLCTKLIQYSQTYTQPINVDQLIQLECVISLWLKLTKQFIVLRRLCDYWLLDEELQGGSHLSARSCANRTRTSLDC